MLVRLPFNRSGVWMLENEPFHHCRMNNNDTSNSVIVRQTTLPLSQHYNQEAKGNKANNGYGRGDESIAFCGVVVCVCRTHLCAITVLFLVFGCLTSHFSSCSARSSRLTHTHTIRIEKHGAITSFLYHILIRFEYCNCFSPSPSLIRSLPKMKNQINKKKKI